MDSDRCAFIVFSFRLMEMCWEEQPGDRIGFHDLSFRLLEVSGTTTHSHSATGWKCSIYCLGHKTEVHRASCGVVEFRDRSFVLTRSTRNDYNLFGVINSAIFIAFCSLHITLFDLFSYFRPYSSFVMILSTILLATANLDIAPHRD